MAQDTYGNKILNLFFYIKGSKDYPTGHLISDNFGFSSTDHTETAIFNNSIRDLLIRTPNPKEVDNIYSLYSDDNNGIEPRSDKSMRIDRTQEYISSMFIPNGKDDIFKNIYPNYTEDDLETIINADTSVNKVPVRESVFWQKMFTLLEFLKHQEETILALDLTNNGNPDAFVSNGANQGWFGGSSGVETSTEYIAASNFLKKEHAVGKLISLFIGGADSPVRTALENQDAESSYNPFRLPYTQGTPNISSCTDSQKLDEILWGQHGINIRYVPGTAFSIRSTHEKRIQYVSFDVKYQPTKTSGIDQTWKIIAYFDPDAFVKKSDDKDEFSVWTYNDQDLDGKYTDLQADGFNIYDNDYANLLSDDDNIKGHFVATKNEIQDAIVKEIFNRSKTGKYSGYISYEAKRVTPEISDDGKELVWAKSANQTFLIFYTNTQPTTSQSMTLVIDYLKQLHMNCSPMKKDEEGNIIYIGHGIGNGDEGNVDTNNFLSKMYPDLFSDIKLHIIPANYTLCNGGGSNVENTFKPDQYFHTCTPRRIHDTLTGVVGEFSNFKFNPNGDITTGDKDYGPAEVFYIGGRQTSPNQDPLTFPFPWICTMHNANQGNPLTSQTGFTQYKQKLFALGDSVDTAVDKFQMILIQLAIKMFVDDNNKPRFGRIAGVDMTYGIDTVMDPTIANKYAYNTVSFIINNIEFVVYAQHNKTFGSTITEPTLSDI